MRNSILMMLGSVVGISIVFGMLVLNNPDLKKEAERQIHSVLKTTGKLVRYYQNGVGVVAQEECPEEPEETAASWNQAEYQAQRFV